jgi:hypothetical protein
MAEICWSHWALQVESFVDACRGNPKKYRLSADCEATAAFCGVEPMVWNEYNPLPDYDAYRSRVDVVRLLLRAAHGVRGERQSRPPARQGLRLIVGGKK